MFEISNILLACYPVVVIAVKLPFISQSRALGRWCGAAPPCPGAAPALLEMWGGSFSFLLVLLNLTSSSGIFWVLLCACKPRWVWDAQCGSVPCLWWGASKWCLPFDSISTPVPAPLLRNWGAGGPSIKKWGSPFRVKCVPGLAEVTWWMGASWQ